MKFFLDCEFIDTGREVHLASIGLVREDGSRYYAELDDCPHHLGCEWYQKNVFPHFHGLTIARERVAAELNNFCGAKPEFWGWFGSYDWICLCQLYGRMLDMPKGWPMYINETMQFMRGAGVGRWDLPKHMGIQHHALDDAVHQKNIYDYIVNHSK